MPAGGLGDFPAIWTNGVLKNESIFKLLPPTCTSNKIREHLEDLLKTKTNCCLDCDDLVPTFHGMWELGNDRGRQLL